MLLLYKILAVCFTQCSHEWSYIRRRWTDSFYVYLSIGYLSPFTNILAMCRNGKSICRICRSICRNCSCVWGGYLLIRRFWFLFLGVNSDRLFCRRIVWNTHLEQLINPTGSPSQNKKRQTSDLKSVYISLPTADIVSPHTCPAAYIYILYLLHAV